MERPVQRNSVNSLQPILRLPDIRDVIDRISTVEATYNGTTRFIDEWRHDYLASIHQNRQMLAVSIFNRFVNCLLERATSGESFERRQSRINVLFNSFADYTPQKIDEMLEDSGYRFPAKGHVVVLEAKEVVTAADFTWGNYIQTAEQNFEVDFSDDKFLKVKGVAFKTRDLALSELSNMFVAIDTHVVRVTTRIGLFLHGYGDPRISTDVSDGKAYLFYHDLMLRLSRQTGWPSAGHSLGEIDRILWHFGRTICKATPLCRQCPISTLCCTAIRHEV